MGSGDGGEGRPARVSISDMRAASFGDAAMPAGSNVSFDEVYPALAGGHPGERGARRSVGSGTAGADLLLVSTGQDSRADVQIVGDNTRQAGSDGEPAHRRSQRLDSGRSIAEQMGQQGDNKPFLDRTRQMPPPGEVRDRYIYWGDGVERRQLNPGETPRVAVVFQDTNPDAAPQSPDFVVRKDGTVEVRNNPETGRQAEIVIQVEREQGQLEPTRAQQDALRELLPYLDARLKIQYPDATSRGIAVEDPQGLIPEETRQQIRPRPGDGLDNLPPPTRRAVENWNRMGGGGGGRMSRGDVEENIPRREVPRQANESQRLAALKDVMASLATRGEREPYQAVQHRGHRGWGFGRYGMTYDMLSSWLENLDIENIEELERQGKVPPGTAARLKRMQQAVRQAKENGGEPDDPFLQKLKAGDRNNPVSAEDINNNFGKELQELAASDLVRQLAIETRDFDGSINVGRLALAFHLGRVPAAEDLERSEYRQLMQAAERAYPIAEARQLNPDYRHIDWTETQGRILAVAQQSVGQRLWTDAGSTRNGRLGCADSTSTVFEMAGITGARSLSVTDQVQKLEAQGWRRVHLDDVLASGQAERYAGGLVFGVQPGRRYGGSAHVGILGANGDIYHNSSSKRRWDYDSNVNSVITRRRFGDNRWVLVPPDAVRNTSS